MSDHPVSIDEIEGGHIPRENRKRKKPKLRGTTFAFCWYAPDETDPTYLHMVAEGYEEYV